MWKSVDCDRRIGASPCADDHFGVAALAVDHRVRVAHPGPGEQRGKGAVLRGDGLGRSLGHGELAAAPHFSQGVAEAAGDGQGVGELWRVEAEELAGCRRRGELRLDRGQVESALARAVGALPVGREVPEADMDFVGDREAEEHVLAGEPLHLGDRQRRADIDARMMRVAEGGVVVEVEIADGQRVQEGGLLGRGLPAGADHRGLRVAALMTHHLGRDADRLAVDRADGAAERVEKQSLGLGDDLRRESPRT